MLGIEINKVISIAFMLGSAIAALTGIMWGLKYGQLSYDMGFILGVKAFVGCVIGGIGSIPGALIGGFTLALIEVMSSALLPPSASLYSGGIIYLALIIVLLLKPSGIMGYEQEV